MTHPVRIGINGFGRIGRCLFKNALARGATVAGSTTSPTSATSRIS